MLNIGNYRVVPRTVAVPPTCANLPQGMIMKEPHNEDVALPQGVSSDDVLCGRGKRVNDFIGNRRFRDLVMSYRERYANCPRRSEKRVICKCIMEAVRSRGGRFLTKQEDDSVAWIPLEEEKVISKILQALRENAAKWNKVVEKATNMVPSKAELSYERNTETMSIVSNDSNQENRVLSTNTLESLADNDDMTTMSIDKANVFPIPPGVTPYDVLCGRGKSANNFIGNRRFRDTVMKYRDDYSKSTRADKRVICKQIVNDVHSRGGRFLTRSGEGWANLDDQKIFLKVSQALRENAATRWNKATQKYKAAHAKKVALQSSAPAMAFLAEMSSLRHSLKI